MTAAAVGGIVLAAGAGTRFGGPKALATLHGERLPERAAGLLRGAGCAPIVVVVGASADEVERSIDVAPAVVVRNPAWASGMGSSLRVGLQALEGACGAAVIALADQPLVGGEAVSRLIAAWRRGAEIAVATYGGVQRNPVLIDARLWPAVIERAVGDVGAREFLTANPDLVTGVPCGDVALPDDVDTPQDLRAAAARSSTFS
jgi:CTP:molybdopterin cytidylyltransferase MocA